MSDISMIGVLTAFAAGIVSFLSPCVLPLVPGYLAYVAGHSVNGVAQPASGHARLSELTLSALFGLFMTGLVKLPWLMRDLRVHTHIPGGRPLGAYGLGLPFLASAFFTGALVRRFQALRRAGRALQIGAGVIMIIMGIAIMTGQLTTFSYWLLQTFPSLAKIG
jgi:cytochrome c-type biogenesis protein